MFHGQACASGKPPRPWENAHVALDLEKRQRLQPGDTVRLERESGEAMKGEVVLAEPEGIDVVVDGPIVEGEMLSVSRTVRDDARYTAVMQVVDAGPGRSRIRLMGDWRRVQLRQFVRVNVYGVALDVSGAGAHSEGRTPRLVDVSAGGLRFESWDAYEMGTELELSFNLPQTGPVSVKGTIVRMAESRGEGESGPRQYGIRFHGMDEAARVKLMTWVFAEQSRRFREKKRDASGG